VCFNILGGAIGSAFGCYDCKVQATGRFLVRSQAEELILLPSIRRLIVFFCFRWVDDILIVVPTCVDCDRVKVCVWIYKRSGTGMHQIVDASET